MGAMALLSARPSTKLSHAEPSNVERRHDSRRSSTRLRSVLCVVCMFNTAIGCANIGKRSSKAVRSGAATAAECAVGETLDKLGGGS